VAHNEGGRSVLGEDANSLRSDFLGFFRRMRKDQPTNGSGMRGEGMRRVVIHTILIVISILSLVPFGWMVLASLKEMDEMQNVNPFPTKYHPENYLEVFRQIPFAKYYFNSIFVAAWTTSLVVLTSAMAAFAFARIKWSGRERLFMLYLGTMMIPGLVTMIPNFTLMVKFQLFDTLRGLILPGAFSAFGTFMLRQFMRSVPPALDEAAEMDGASKWQVFWDVVMPLSRPALITLAIFTFMGSYGSFFWPLVMVKSEHLRTLPIGMMYFDSEYKKATNLLMAASVMNVIPLILMFIAGQRYFVKGIMLGGVKG
jgi:multiple sugar transport system permease protein